MNKKLYQTHPLDYQEINYSKVFKTKLQITKYEQHDQRNLYKNGETEIYGSFDSSNIYYAKELDKTICILLHSDSNSQGCTQWFNFKVKSQGIQLFKILNNRRPHSLAVTNNIYSSSGSAYDIFYYKTNIFHPFYRSKDKDIAAYQQKVSLYTLEFKYFFTNNELIQFAYAEPYPVSRYLDLMKYNHNIIGYTQLRFPLIEIKLGQGDKIIVVFARQHPSETSGSWVCEHLLKLVDSKQYQYIFYPMINPDGVFLGNSRCNYHGQDLNRKWSHPNASTEQEVDYVKKSVEKYINKVEVFIDLHGHSSKLNYFIFGCVKNQKYLQIRHFLHPIQQHKLFSFQDCSFKVKPQTARCLFFNQFNVKHSLTVEISQYGVYERRFTQQDYLQIALKLYDAIENYNEQNALSPFNPPNNEDDSDSQGDEDLIVQEEQNQQKLIKTSNSPIKQRKQQYFLPQIDYMKKSNIRKHSCNCSEVERPRSRQYRCASSSSDPFSPIQAFPQRLKHPKMMGSLKPKFFGLNLEQLNLLKQLVQVNHLQ